LRYGPEVSDLPFPVVLASASPRRKTLLASLVRRFEVDPPDVDETTPEDADPWRAAEELAQLKVEEVRRRRPNSLVVAGDTVVAIETAGGFRLLGKPADVDEACAMLRTLSGRTHIVVTGLCLAWPGGTDVSSESSRVTFRKLSDDEIAAYVRTGEPLDKAGGYGLQGGARDFVARIEGSESNVVGLPVDLLRARLEDLFG
jgi:septum formation protein